MAAIYDGCKQDSRRVYLGKLLLLLMVSIIERKSYTAVISRLYPERSFLKIL